MITIEFFGLSRTGKTTQSRRLVDDLSSRGVSVKVYQRPKINFTDLPSMDAWHEMMISSKITQYHSSLESGADFLIYDRGFLDRKVMLDLDFAAGTIRRQTHNKISSSLHTYIKKVNFPLLFLVDPATSLSRVESQMVNGLDNSHFCKGMSKRDDFKGLSELIPAYVKEASQYKNITQIFSNESEDEVYKKVCLVIGMNGALPHE